jgi:phage terminase large subunit-like protein
MDWYQAAIKRLEKLPKEAQERRQLCLDDLWVFAQTMNPGYAYGDVHKSIYRWLQVYTLYNTDAGQTSNKLILLPRAHLKSHIIATWVSWMVTRHPEITILYVSATAELAETQLYAIKGILESGPYQYFFPEYIHPQDGKRDTWNNRKISLDHPERARQGIRDATISTAGLTTNTTGWHADVICGDDLVVPENAYTEEGRDAVRKKASQFTSIRNPGGFTIAAGTRYHPSDIYDTWKGQRYDVYDVEGNITDVLPTWDIVEYAVEKDGLFLWPRSKNEEGKSFGFDNNALSRIKSEYVDSVQFYAQYYNNPNDPGSNRIRRDRFQYIEPKQITYSDGDWYVRGKRVNIYAAIDFAYTVRKTSDYTAIVVIGIDCDGYIYVLDIDRFKTDKIVVMFEHIAELHSKWRIRKLRAEVTAAQSIIAEDLKDRIRQEGMNLSIDEFRPSRKEGSKEERMAAVLEPRYENLSVFHVKGGYTNALEEELILARPKNDDIKDALASAIEIAKKPSRAGNAERTNNITYGRFGGVAFRRTF